MTKEDTNSIIELYRFETSICSSTNDHQSSDLGSSGAPETEAIGEPQDPDGHRLYDPKHIPSSNKDEESVDLVTYRPPDALTMLDQQRIDPAILALVNNSIRDVRIQITREVKSRLQRERRRGFGSEEGDLELVDQHENPDTIPPILSDAFDDMTSEPCYTPSDVNTLPSPAHSTKGIKATAVETATIVPVMDATAMPRRPNGLPSTRLQLRRRNLLNVVLSRLGGKVERRNFSNLPSEAPTSSDIQLRKKFKKFKEIVGHFSMDKGECISCLDDFFFRHLVQLHCHNYCKPCFRRLVEHSIEKEAHWPPRCCLIPVDHKICVKYSSGALQKKFLQKRQEYLTPISQRYYCPVPDCGIFVPADKIDRAYAQAKCSSSHLTCTDCRQIGHDDATDCVKNKDMEIVQQIAFKEGWRRCYRCHTMVEHRVACRHMTCVCGAEFCYVCGQVWWTCSCTEKQLDDIKKRAKLSEARRKQHDEQEIAETRELRETLEMIENMEAAEAEKREKIRAAKECRRKNQVQQRFAEIKARLAELHTFQKQVLDSQHQRDRECLASKFLSALNGLDSKSAEKFDKVQGMAQATMEEWQDNWQLEEQEQDGNKTEGPARSTDGSNISAQCTEFVKSECHVDGRDNVHTALCDEVNSVDTKKNESSLVQLRSICDEELVAESEKLYVKRQRIRTSFDRQRSELQTKIQSELRWFTLVLLERSRQLDGRLELELTNEIVDEGDDRWNLYWVYEEFEEGDR